MVSLSQSVRVLVTTSCNACVLPRKATLIESSVGQVKVTLIERDVSPEVCKTKMRRPDTDTQWLRSRLERWYVTIATFDRWWTII